MAALNWLKKKGGNMGKNFPNHLGLKLIGYFLLGPISLFAVFFVVTTVGFEDMPASAPFIMTGALVSILTLLAIRFGLRTTLSLPKKTLVYMAAYNILIVVIKFILSPLALYTANDRKEFSLAWSGWPMFVVLGSLVFLIYLIIFSTVFSAQKRKVEVALAAPNAPAHHAKFPVVRRIFISALIVALALLVGGETALVMGVFSVFIVPEYLIYISMTVYGACIAGALVMMVEFMKRSFGAAAEQAIAMRDMTIMTSLYWVCLSFLAAYHAIWVVYLIGLTTLWPLDTQSPE